VSAGIILDGGIGLGFVDGVRHFVVEYGYLAVFLGILLENFGLPTPGETILIAGAVLASRGSLEIVWVLPIAWFAAVIGNSIGYVIGVTGGNKLLVRYGARIGITHQRLQKVEELFARYGDIIIIGARFFVVLRQFSGIVAGTLEMPWPRFLLYNAIGAALWVGVWGGATYWLGRRFFDYLRALSGTGHLVIALGALALIAVAVTLWHRHKEAAEKRARGEAAKENR